MKTNIGDTIEIYALSGNAKKGVLCVIAHDANIVVLTLVGKKRERILFALKDAYNYNNLQTRIVLIEKANFIFDFQ